ncbi:MAG: small conductance mechanosensitive channel [Myxococcota bacterium]|jgi:small conductance mechanosensitive channel
MRNRIVDGWLPLIISYGVRIVGVLLVFWIANRVATWLQNRTVAEMTRGGFDATLAKFLASLARYSILVMTLLSCLELFGIETTSFAAVLLTCELRDGAGLRVIVPNSAMFGTTIQHVANEGIRRVDIDVGAEYPADIDATRAALAAAVATIDAPIDRDMPNGPFLVGLGSSSVDWQLRLYCKPEDYWPVWEAGVRAAKMALDEANIGIPYNTIDVNIVKDD